MLNRELLIAELSKDNEQFKNHFSIYEQTARHQNIPVTEYLHSLGSFDSQTLRDVFARAYGVEQAPAKLRGLLELTEKYIPLKVAQAQHLTVFSEDENLVKVATDNPANLDVISHIEKKTHKKVQIYYAFPEEILKALKKKTADLSEQIEHLKVGDIRDFNDMEALQNSTKLLDIILLNSIEYGASDIHIEPHQGRLIIRFRIDGMLKDILELPEEFAEVINTRIKVLAEMRTDEHQKPQDGRFKLKLNDTTEITTRVSILPIYEGEKIVMRILTEKKQKINLTDLGYTQQNQEIIYSNTQKANGMLLVTGPTGSGKTTTLYTVLKLLNKTDVNLMTVEDPIEYRLDRVNQIQVNSQAGLTFASGLRSILRQDPDIVMVGEIRDEETANIAVNAALTGHLVLATLHTNSSSDTLPRLLQMNVEPYLVASTVNVVVAQRLVRKLCDKCKKPVVFAMEKLKQGIGADLETDFGKRFISRAEAMITEGSTIYLSEGCKACNKLGYQGRLAIAEVLEVDDQVKEQIFANASPLEIEEAARSRGFKDLLEDGLAKVLAGQTTIEELIRVIKT